MLISIATINPIKAAEAYDPKLFKFFLVVVPITAIVMNTVEEATNAEAMLRPV